MQALPILNRCYICGGLTYRYEILSVKMGLKRVKFYECYIHEGIVDQIVMRGIKMKEYLENTMEAYR